MATYAAVVSVIHLMEQIQSYQARNPIFDDSQQSQLESLGEKVSFLQDFLETYSYRDSDEAESLESRIVDAAYAAEDLIESYIVDDIHRRKTKIQSEKNETNLNLGRSTIPATLISNKFSQDVQNVIDSIDSIKREILEIKDKSSVPNDPRHPKEPEQATASSGLLNIEKDSVVGFDDIYPHHRNEPEQAAGSLGLLNIEKDTVVGFDDIFNSIMEKLTEKKTNLQVITITGMGGSGKSTLAKKVYDHPFVKQHFDVCGWVTVSQEFNVKEVLSGLLREISRKRNFECFEYHELGVKLHKHLSGMRFFIVIDDIWSVEAWDMIKMFLQGNRGSRIVTTTRLSNLANIIGSSHTYKIELLDDTQSWRLLCKKVFGQESCPLVELEEVGKLAAEKCKGLPLSIVVIGELLRKSIKLEYWEYIADDISANVNSEDNEHCLKILYTSYKHLPIHLKSCFLYLGVFPEGHEIRVTELIMLWVAERFIKSNKAKSLEEVAIDYLKDLIDRNLIFVTKLGSTGSVKRCKVHDLLRDLCLREATNKKFLHVSKTLKLETSQGLNSHRRLAVCGEIPDSLLSSSPFLRSFICYYNSSLHSFDVKLLSVLNYVYNIRNDIDDIYELVNLRYLKLRTYYQQFLHLVYHLWNVQTLILRDGDISLPSEIWAMSQLRHIIINGFTLDDPCVGKSDEEYNIVLQNIQTLEGICDFRCSEEVLRKIPNVKKLSIVYEDITFPFEYLKNLGRLTRLESLKCDCVRGFSLSALEFSLSLKKLHLEVDEWDWEDIGTKVGLLPHLEKFTLYYRYGGEEWNVVDDQFPCLKYLKMSSYTLIHWRVDCFRLFPHLEHLHLWIMNKLEEIPYEIGEIESLRSIKVSYSSDTAINSANRIRDQQRSVGKNDLLVEISSWD